VRNEELKSFGDVHWRAIQTKAIDETLDSTRELEENQQMKVRREKFSIRSSV